MSVIGQLLREGTGNAGGSQDVVDEPAPEMEEGAEASSSDDETEEETPKTAAERAREILQGAKALEEECSQLVTALRAGSEKTASEGGDASEQEQSAEFLEKIATTLGVQRRYAAGVLKTAASNAQLVEAMKLASDLMEQGKLEVPEGASIFDVVSNLAKKDLGAVKVASELFGDAAIANSLGSAEKIGSDKPENGKLDGSMSSWAKAHTWLTDG